MRALIIGESGGIGAAMAEHLRAHEWEVVGLSRRGDGLDLTDEASIAEHAGRLRGEFDQIIIATGSLGAPEKSLSSLSAQELQSQFAVNAMGPVLAIKHFAEFLPRDRRASLGVLSARVGSIGDNRLGGWYSYRAAKAALNQLVHGAAIELGRKYPHLVVAALHPGTVDTAFTQGYAREKLSPRQSAEKLLEVMDALVPEQSGGFWDYSGAAVVW